MRLFIFICLLAILSGCSNNRNFDTPDQFKKWVEGKTFTSNGNDLDQMDSHGNYKSPIGNLVLQFNRDRVTYQNCPPSGYEVFKDIDDWVVSVKSCDGNDSFDLVIPPSGDMYMRSYDYDISGLNSDPNSSAVVKLDEIVSKKVTRGPTMEITDDHDIKPFTKEQLDSVKKADSTILESPSEAKVIRAKESQPLDNIEVMNGEYQIVNGMNDESENSFTIEDGNTYMDLVGQNYIDIRIGEISKNRYDFFLVGLREAAGITSAQIKVYSTEKPIASILKSSGKLKFHWIGLYNTSTNRVDYSDLNANPGNNFELKRVK